MKIVVLSDVIQVLINEEYLNHVEITPHVKPSHGPCCTCQKCGYYHDECVCDDNSLLEALEHIAIDMPDANIISQWQNVQVPASITKTASSANKRLEKSAADVRKN